MEGEVYVTEHAAERWCERIAAVGKTSATIAIVGMWRRGYHQENPPKWLRRTRSYTPGRELLLVMCEEHPGVALIVGPGYQPGDPWRVITVLDRKSARTYLEAQNLAHNRSGANGVAGKRKAGRLVRRRRLEAEDSDGWEGAGAWRR